MLSSNQIKKIAAGMSVHEETYDRCTNCQSETAISELNLVTGSCSVCNTNKIKLTNEQIKELLELDVGME